MYYHLFMAARSLRRCSSQVLVRLHPAELPAARSELTGGLSHRPRRAVQDVATAALFFASKVEDTPKRAREVVFAARTILGDLDVTSGDAQATSVMLHKTQ